MDKYRPFFEGLGGALVVFLIGRGIIWDMEGVIPYIILGICCIGAFIICRSDVLRSFNRES